MSTLRVSNIEAKADASSPTINEKVTIKNSSGNVMLQLDGATAGVTTIGINSTSATFTVDSAQNVRFVGVVTAASFSGAVNSSGVSTFATGPVLIGSGTSTGTASQPLQVTGGAYVGGNLGVGISNPNSPLDIQGGQFRIRSSGTFSDPTDNAGIIAYDSISGDFTISARSSGGSTALAFRTSSGGTGGEKARIDASGNFGLGTNNPQIKLDVRQDSSSTTVMAGVRVQNTNITTGSQSGIAFLNYDNYNAKIYSPRSGSSQGDIVFATNNGGGISESNVVERARIDSSGRVTMPYQPAILMTSTSTSGAQTFTNNVEAKVTVYNSTVFSRGLTWDGTNNRVTVPVTGWYQVYAKLNMDNQYTMGNDDVLYVRKNGSSGWMAAGNTHGYQPKPYLSYYHAYMYSMALYCTANDYLEIWFVQSSGSNKSAYGTMSYFYCYLLG
jgi:hypothetical protein